MTSHLLGTWGTEGPSSPELTAGTHTAVLPFPKSQGKPSSLEELSDSSSSAQHCQWLLGLACAAAGVAQLCSRSCRALNRACQGRGAVPLTP